AAANSNNVLDEVSYALDKQKHIIPILHRDCEIPFRIRRFQHLDFRSDYDRMLTELQKCLHTGTAAAPSAGPIEHPVHPPADHFRTPLRKEPPVSAVAKAAATASSGSAWPTSRWITIAAVAIVVIAVIFLLSRWNSSEKLKRQQEAAALRSSSTAMAVPVEAEIHTGLAHGQSNPPC